MARKVGAQGVGGVPPDLAARVGREHPDDLLHQRNRHEDSCCSHEGTERTARHRLVDEVPHDLRIDKLKADVGQDQHGGEGHEPLLLPNVLEQESTVLP